MNSSVRISPTVAGLRFVVSIFASLHLWLWSSITLLASVSSLMYLAISWLESAVMRRR
ncbi:MAG: hypothetical protein K2Z80_33570 [Xanthobacteraceae bacterium]|nr:hypothetical protein [Xanthobacteraceae bacterium]